MSDRDEHESIIFRRKIVKKYLVTVLLTAMAFMAGCSVQNEAASSSPDQTAVSAADDPLLFITNCRWSDFDLAKKSIVRLTNGCYVYQDDMIISAADVAEIMGETARKVSERKNGNYHPDSLKTANKRSLKFHFSGDFGINRSDGSVIDSDTMKEFCRNAMQKWMKAANIVFIETFIEGYKIEAQDFMMIPWSPGTPGSCILDQITIYREPLKSTNYTTNYIESIFLHELGHLLGLWHEHARWDSPGNPEVNRRWFIQFVKEQDRYFWGIEVNWKTTIYDIPYDIYVGSQETKYNYLRGLGITAYGTIVSGLEDAPFMPVGGYDYGTEFEAYDKDSIMNYNHDSSYRNALSAGDIRTIQYLYGTPVIPFSSVAVSSFDPYNNKFTVHVSNVGLADKVLFPTWTDYNGQDELVWHEGIYDAFNKLWYADIYISRHKYETGNYTVHIYGITSGNTTNYMTAQSVNIQKPYNNWMLGSESQDTGLSRSATTNINLISTYSRKGAYNGASYFNGSNSFADCGNAMDNVNNNFTVSFWINGTTAGQPYHLVLLSKGHTACTGWTIQGTSGGDIQFIGGNGSVWMMGARIPRATLLDGSWHNIVVVKSTAGSKIYKDGVLFSNDTTATSDIVNTAGFRFSIGKDTYNPGRNFKGSMDDVMTFNRVLSDQEISELYSFGY